ncbi:hypothetical protein DFS34DRAFT_141183 [Phlyctochytrium arcticum]|nr:hypothetical protein DFS34DRAFT_141183 [Phlyctochytrium arcticum]
MSAMDPGGSSQYFKRSSFLKGWGASPGNDDSNFAFPSNNSFEKNTTPTNLFNGADGPELNTLNDFTPPPEDPNTNKPNQSSQEDHLTIQRQNKQRLENAEYNYSSVSPELRKATTQARDMPHTENHDEQDVVTVQKLVPHQSSHNFGANVEVENELAVTMMSLAEHIQQQNSSRQKKLDELTDDLDRAQACVYHQTGALTKMKENNQLIIEATNWQRQKAKINHERIEIMKKNCKLYQVSIKKLGRLIDDTQSERETITKSMQETKAALCKVKEDKAELQLRLKKVNLQCQSYKLPCKLS